MPSCFDKVFPTVNLYKAWTGEACPLARLPHLKFVEVNNCLWMAGKFEGCGEAGGRRVAYSSKVMMASKGSG
ncbi:MAG: hypothetical protein IPK17_14885 [Chloroflexi bacterium]|uniref:hypothetical protein n=1 Tax=Candidatus Flexifilum breve TaxID=3140694 RepID=UPI0031350A59|nr:hypothetical protein [Chloroflexota bacterium]